MSFHKIFFNSVYKDKIRQYVYIKMSYMLLLPKRKDIIEKKIIDSSVGIFIDNSGSTSSLTNGIETLNLEIKIALTFDHIKNVTTCSWDTRSEIIYNMCNCKPSGGTSPQCVISNPTTRKIFEDASTIIFMTDGEISGRDVSEFADAIKDIIKTKSIICVIVCSGRNDPNISVFAPFLIAKDVMFMHYDGGEYGNILFSKGQFEKQYIKNSKTPITLLKNTKVVNNMPDIPQGYVVIDENNEYVKVYSFDKLMEAENISQDSLSTNEWNTIIQHAKINDKLTQLRDKISVLRNKNIAATIETLKTNMLYPLADKKQLLISQIISCDDAIEKEKITKQLRDIIPDARIEEIKNSQIINKSLCSVRAYWDTIRDILYHFESATYHLSDITYASNRAQRAKNVDDSEIINTNIVHSGAPEIFCTLHLDNGPAVLWLHAPDDIDSTTNDFVINFPLSKHTSLQKCIKSNPVCGDCAAGYFAIRKLTAYNEPIDGFIPLNIQNNKQYVYTQLCKILCGNKCLGHINMLLLSMIDDCKYDWMDLNIKTYLINELITNTITTDTFGEEGTKMRMIEALGKLNNDVLFRQPIFAAMRLLILGKIFAKIPNMSIIDFAKDRFRYTLIMCILSSLLKHNYTHIVSIIDKLLYAQECDIPIIQDEKSVMLPGIMDLRVLLSETELNDLVEIIRRLSKLLDIDETQIIPPEMIGEVLCSCKKIMTHERPMTVYKNMITTNQMFKRSITINKNDAVKDIIHDLIGKYKNPGNMVLPPYAIYNGCDSCPSKLFYEDKCLISEFLGKTIIINDNLFTNRVVDQLHHHINTKYGSIHPNERSGHTPVHKIVATICETYFKDLAEPTLEVFAKCIQAMKATNGLKGNIYTRNTLVAIVLCVYDFMSMRKTRKNYYKDNLSMTIYRKMLSEFEEIGAKIYEQDTKVYVDVPKTISFPIDLQIKYANINVDDILNKVEEFMNNHNTEEKVTDHCVNLTVEKPFVIDVPTQNQNFSVWEQEQIDIIKNVQLVDTFKLSDVKLVAGCDISFDKDNVSNAVASMVIFKYPFTKANNETTFEIIGRFNIRCTTNIAYKAGYLAFREAPILLKLLEIIKTDFPHLVPNVICFDGNGVWHPRGCGIATHFSVLTGIPCLGVAKKVLVADGINDDIVHHLLETHAPNEGDIVKVVGNSGKALGYAFNPTGFIANSIYISAGNGMSHELAIELVKSVSIHRVIEPIRQADLLSRKLLVI